MASSPAERIELGRVAGIDAIFDTAIAPLL
jgi:hypothetical protein